ncbi:V8-like Glu-specific endopeptidase [Trichoderma velutinum]
MRFSTVLLGYLVPAAFATPQGPNAPGTDLIEHEYVTTREADAAVRAYWTLERINAIDHDEYLSSDPPPLPEADRPQGAEYTRGGAVHRAVGRLLYTDPNENGKVADSSCTATLVESANGATIVTAAHCAIYPTLNSTNSQWNYNHLFIPGYRDGISMPNYTFNKVIMESDWVNASVLADEFFNDRVYAVLNPDPDSGKSAGENSGVLMKIGFGLNETLYPKVHDFGYPRSTTDHDVYRNGTPAFTGRRLAYCTGKATKWWRFPSILAGEPCQMSGGCSGGPAFVDFNTTTGFGKVVGVNSQIDLSGANSTTATVNLYNSIITDPISKKMWNLAQNAKPVW